MKKMTLFKMIPVFAFVFMTIMMIGMSIAANELYDWVPQGYCYGTGCYLGGKRPGNFYQAAFSYDVTLVGFIFMMISTVVLLATIIVWIFILIKKTIKPSQFTFAIVMGSIMSFTMLMMAIFVAACLEIEDAAGMIPCGFLAMLAAVSLIPYSVIIRKKIRNGEITADGVMATAGRPSPAPVQSSKEDTWVCPDCGAEVSGKFCIKCGAKRPEAKTWKCPNCGAECDDKFKFCMKCGTKKPE